MVALLAEGVDRNQACVAVRAGLSVALLAEGVDRNCVLCEFHAESVGRPPREGRG